MAYYSGKDIEKSRGNAIKELILEKRSIAQVARRYGKNRSTIYRWKKKWESQQIVLLEKLRNLLKISLILWGEKWIYYI